MICSRPTAQSNKLHPAVGAVSAPVTIVAVTYNSADVLPGFLAALPGAATTTPWQLVIVDNNSADSTLEILGGHDVATEVIRSEANIGFAAGINRAIAAVDPLGPVLVINPDVRLHSGAIDAMVAATRTPSVGIVVPQLHDETGRLLYSLRHDPATVRILGEALLGGMRAGRYGIGEMVVRPEHYRTARAADWATGACMLISPECLRRVGLWDEQFFLYSEETDYAIRARKAGLTVRYEPAALATHRGGDVHRSPELFTLLTVNRWRLYRRIHGPARALLFRAALVIDAIPRALAGRATARAALAALLSPRTDPVLGALRN